MVGFLIFSLGMGGQIVHVIFCNFCLCLPDQEAALALGGGNIFCTPFPMGSCLDTL
jgi:hypothetical protein